MEVSLKCECGKVRGVLTGISADSGTRLVCYCDDCQTFANHLGHSQHILDEYGGTEVFLVSPSQIRITTGKEHLRSLRLTQKGILRWYTDCCRTPIANTVSEGIPFVSLIYKFMDNDNRDTTLGPVRGYIQVKFAKDSLPLERKQGFPIGVILSVICKLIVWKIKGLNQPSSFFNSDGSPVSAPVILSK